MRLLFVANVCGMDDSRLTIANHSGSTNLSICMVYLQCKTIIGEVKLGVLG